MHLQSIVPPGIQAHVLQIRTKELASRLILFGSIVRFLYSTLFRVPDMKMVVENVVETIASLNTKEETLQDEINDRYVNRERLETSVETVRQRSWEAMKERQSN
jgi:hypothetical protein